MKKIVTRILCFVLIFAMIIPLSGCDSDGHLVIPKTWDEFWEFIKKRSDDFNDDVNDFKDGASDFLEKAGSKAEEWFDSAKDAIIDMYGTAKDGVIYAYNEAARLTEYGYAKAKAKADELIGNAKQYIDDLMTPVQNNEIEYASVNPNYPLKDNYENYTFDESDSSIVSDRLEVEQFIAYYISSILSARGYRVFNGAIYYKGAFYGGLIFTKDEVFIQENGQNIYSCGFVQLVSSDYDGMIMTDEIAQTGVIAVPVDKNSDADAYIVEDYVSFDSFSGIYNDVYFKYKQVESFVIEITILPNIASNYDRTIELYNFDTERTIQSVKSENESVRRLYYRNQQSFVGAAKTVNAISDIEENEEGQLSTVFFLDGTTLDKVIDKSKRGTNSVADFFKNGIRNINYLSGSQFLSFDESGQANLGGVDSSVDKDRLTNGIISTVGAGLAVAGTVASIVCVAKAGTITISAIVVTTWTSTIVYNVANMLTGIQDIYYGAKGSTKESKNPVLSLFKKLIPDEKTATLVYHIWGAANTILTNIMVPISKSLGISKVKGLNVFQTGVNVVRAAVVTVAKALATGIGAGLVGTYVSKIVARATSNENIGKLVGFGTSLVTGMLIYNKLDSIDREFDISGLYPKTSVKDTFVSTKVDQDKKLYNTNDLTKKQRGEVERMVHDMVDTAAERYGISEKPNVKIIYDKNADFDGLYDNSTKTITVNLRTDSTKTLQGLADTIGHEMQHALQYQQAYSNPYGDMANSLRNYISPQKNGSNYDAYRYQLCEADAWDAGERFANYIMRFYGLG